MVRDGMGKLQSLLGRLTSPLKYQLLRCDLRLVGRFEGEPQYPNNPFKYHNGSSPSDRRHCGHALSFTEDLLIDGPSGSSRWGTVDVEQEYARPDSRALLLMELP